MKRKCNLNKKYLFVFTIVVIAIIAAILIPIFYKKIIAAQIIKHHLNAENIYNEYLQNNLSNDNIIDDLAIKTKEDVYVIYIDGKAIDGIYSYDEVKEKFTYSLVKKYNQNNDILVVYDYDVNNPNSYSKISIDIKDDQSFTISMFYTKFVESIEDELYNSLFDKYYNIFKNYFGDHLTTDITNYVDEEIFEEYVILAIYRDEYINLDFNYSDFNIKSDNDINIIATENKNRESNKKLIDFVFIPKYFVYDALEYLDIPHGDYTSNCLINYNINKEMISKRTIYYSLARGIYEESN